MTEFWNFVKTQNQTFLRNVSHKELHTVENYWIIPAPFYAQVFLLERPGE
jgi:hypothetical protein